MSTRHRRRAARTTRLAAAAAVITLVVTACTSQTESSSPADAEAEAVAEQADGSAQSAVTGVDNVLVTTDWLAENLDADDVHVIEVSTEEGLYERGHIPGAVNYPWHTAFVDTVTRDVVAQEEFTELGQEAGLGEDSTIVLYGDANNWFAAWGAWVFTLYGHDDVRLLDGGRALWEEEGRELAVAQPSPARGDFTAAEADPALRAFLPEVLEVANDEADKGLVDIRSAAEFTGEIIAPEGFDELAVRAGHIPGAVNVPWAEAVNEDGTLKSVDELTELYAAVGIDGSEPIIVYCRIGERASHTWFVLNKVLGYDAKLYDGSWTEYGNTVGVPIVNEAGTVWGGA